MPQDPLLVDQISIEPGAAGTRLIDRDPATGAVRFQDSVITSPLALSQLAGLRNIPNVLIVGKSGSGAQYTTIQAAMTAVPSTSSPTNPYLVLVMPGVYTETLNIVRDGVQLIGVGQPTIESALEATPNAVGNDHTVIISDQLGTIPQKCLIQNFRITNAHDNMAALRVTRVTAATVGGNSQGITVRDCTLLGNAPGGNRPLWTTIVNTISVERCVLGGNTSSLLLMEETATVLGAGCTITAGISLRWDTANPVPTDAAVGYQFENCVEMAGPSLLGVPFAIDLDGSGAASFFNCGTDQTIVISGDQTTLFESCVLEDLSILETSTVQLVNSTREALTAANATAFLLEPQRDGTAAFAAATTAAIVFDVPYQAAFVAYNINLELDGQPANDETAWITGKANTGFTINFATAQTINVRWAATVR